MRYTAFALVLLFSSIVIATEVPYFQNGESSIAQHASTIATALLYNSSYAAPVSLHFSQFEGHYDDYQDVEWQEIIPGLSSPPSSNENYSRQEVLISSSMPSRISRSYQPLYENGFPTPAFFEALENEHSELQQCSKIMLQWAAIEQQFIFRNMQ